MVDLYETTDDLAAARRLHAEAGGWLLDMGDGHYMVTDDEASVREMRSHLGAGYMDELAARGHDETRTTEVSDTLAQRCADAMGGDGTVSEAPDGRDLGDVASDLGASWSAWREVFDDEGHGEWVRVYSGGIWDIERWEFPDGSAIVISGGSWDIEGAKFGSWAGA